MDENGGYFTSKSVRNRHIINLKSFLNVGFVAYLSCLLKNSKRTFCLDYELVSNLFSHTFQYAGIIIDIILRMRLIE